MFTLENVQKDDEWEKLQLFDRCKRPICYPLSSSRMLEEVLDAYFTQTLLP